MDGILQEPAETLAERCGLYYPFLKDPLPMCNPNDPKSNAMYNSNYTRYLWGSRGLGVQDIDC